MTATILRTIALAWAALFFLVGQAHAQSARDALAALCPTARIDASLIEAAADESRVPAVVLVAQMVPESSCGVKLVNVRTGALGLLQVMPGRSADPDHLERDELLDPETNVRLGARHLRRCLNLCGTLPAGLHVFHGGKKCREWRGDRYVKRVLGLVARAKRVIARMQAARS